MTDFDPLDTFRASVAAAPDPDRSSRIRDEFRARIATMPADAGGRRPFDPPAPRLRPRLRTAAALAGVALALVLAAGGALWPRGDRTGSPSLDELAVAAARQPDRPLAEGQHLYRSERSTDDGGQPTLEAQWTAADGTGRRQVGPLAPGSGATTPPTVTEHPEPDGLRFAGLTYGELRDLPTEPTALVQALRRSGATDGSSTVADAHALADVLSLAVTPPGVAAAAVDALGALGGVAVGPVTDDAGRTGVGVRGVAADGSTWLVVLDPGTGRARAFEPHGADDAAPVPARLWLDQQITDGAPR